MDGAAGRGDAGSVGEIGVIRFPCNYCDREFLSSQALAGHMNSHREERNEQQRAYWQSIGVLLPPRHLPALPPPNLAALSAAQNQFQLQINHPNNTIPVNRHMYNYTPYLPYYVPQQQQRFPQWRASTDYAAQWRASTDYAAQWPPLQAGNDIPYQPFTFNWNGRHYVVLGTPSQGYFVPPNTVIMPHVGIEGPVAAVATNVARVVECNQTPYQQQQQQQRDDQTAPSTMVDAMVTRAQVKEDDSDSKLDLSLHL